MSRGATAWLLGALAGAAALVAVAAGGGAPARQPLFEVTGLYPDFDPGVHRYVARCGAGGARAHVEAPGGARVTVGAAPPREGSFSADPGVRPGEDFAVRILRGGSDSSYRVRCLPAMFPAWDFESFRRAAPGMFAVAMGPSRNRPPWIVIFDHEGMPRWWHAPEIRALWAQVLRDGTITWARSFGDGYGLRPRSAHEIRTLSGRLLRLVRASGVIVDGHELYQLPDGNLLVPAYVPREGVDLSSVGGPSDTAAVFAEIQELDPLGRLVWRWTSPPHISLAETVPRWWESLLNNAKRVRSGAWAYDPVHVNSIEPWGEERLIVSMRHADAIYGVDRSSGEIVWKLGGSETPQSLRVVGDPATDPLFGGQHDVRIDSRGRLTVFDNGKDYSRLPRVVSYRLDLRQGTATYLGQINDGTVRYSHCCGSAREIEGGMLVSWGDNPVVSAFDEEGRLLFRLRLPAPSYRAVPVPPGAVGAAELERGVEAMEDEPVIWPRVRSAGD